MPYLSAIRDNPVDVNRGKGGIFGHRVALKKSGGGTELTRCNSPRESHSHDNSTSPSSLDFLVNKSDRRSFHCPSVLLLRHQPALAFAFRFANRFPVGNGLDFASPILAVSAMFSVFGLAENPLVEFLIAD
jgi:hypothetical protein